MSKISYILVNYRTPELTCSCLGSLYTHCGTEAAEVIVVDNGSLPGNGSDAARIRKAFPQTIVIESPDNIGFGNACNLAADRAEGEYFYIVNTDLEFTSDAGKALVDFLDATPSAWGAGSRIVNPDGSWQPSAGNFPDLLRILAGRKVIADKLRPAFPGAARRLEMFLSEKDLASSRPVDWCTGASLMLRADRFRQLGGFDPAIFLYAEELDLQKRIQELGGEIWYVPEASVLHHEAGSSDGKTSPERLSCISAGHRYYYRKYHGFLVGGLMIFADYAGSLSKEAYWRLSNLFFSSKQARRKLAWHRQARRQFFARNYGPDRCSNAMAYLTWGMIQPRDGSLKSKIRSVTGVTSIHTRIRGWHMLKTLKSAPLPARVLEVGFGEGDLLLTLARKFPDTEFEGWEVDAGLADMAQQKAESLNLTNILFIVRNYVKASPTKTFGLIFCADVLEHIPDDLGAIRCFFGLLEPGGRLVVHVPFTGTRQRRFLPWFSHHSEPGHVRPEYNEQQLTELLAQGGFSNIVVNRTFGPFGEAAFELNSLAWQHANLDRVVRMITLLPAIAIGCFDALLPVREGNSLLAQSEKKAQ